MSERGTRVQAQPQAKVRQFSSACTDAISNGNHTTDAHLRYFDPCLQHISPFQAVHIILFLVVRAHEVHHLESISGASELRGVRLKPLTWSKSL
jgi:hypothetical protein